MFISDMERLLTVLRAQHGDMHLTCGGVEIAGIAVIQGIRIHTASILLKPPTPAPSLRAA
jgi:hypothetical protein